MKERVLKHLTVSAFIFLLLLCLGPTADAARDDSNCGPSGPEADRGWLGLAQQHILDREYHASWNGQGLQAPNRANNLRIYFDTCGIGVMDRIGSDGSELLHLTLVGLTRGSEDVSDCDLLVNPSMLNSGNRVEIRRGGLTEWFVNSPNGLEHGFVLPSRPSGAGELRLTLEVSAARAEMEGDHVLLSSPGGRKLKYSDLYVVDAEGRDVLATLDVPDPGTIQILISDLDAAYPLTIDPILTSTADTIVESDQVEASMGDSVSGAGDVNGDGYADVIVGASRYDNGTENEGAAFVYHGSATGLSTTAAAMVESNRYWALMGCSVSGAGDVNGDGYADVIVGAKMYSPGGGRAYIFHGSPTGISTVAATTLDPDLSGNPRFGTSVSGAGDVNEDGYADVIVGADGYSGEGGAFVYHGGAAGIPTTPATTVVSGQANAYMGESVSGAGDVNADGYDDVIVGSKFYSNGSYREGAALVYYGSATGIPTTVSAILDINVENAYLGRHVSDAGDVNGDGIADVVVSSTLGGVNPGIAFVFFGSLWGIATGPDAMMESDQVGAGLVSVSGAGDVNGDGYADVIAGAPGYDNGETGEGAGLIYYGGPSTVMMMYLTPSARVESNLTGVGMGNSVAGAGDVNGDGYADVIVGASNYTNGESGEGAAFVFHGGASGISPTVAAMMESDQDAALLGWSVSDAGDVNGDGCGDVIVGAFGYDNGEPDEGAAFVYHGSADGLSATAAAMVESDQGYAYLGWSVSGAGDVNGDGYADVVAGAINYDDGQTDEGAFFVYHGSPSGISSTAAAMVQSDQDLALMGWSVSGAGDLNGDGFADLIVSAPTYDNGETDEGVAYVYHGSASGISTTPAAMVEPDQPGFILGYSVSGAGDVNRDGYADLIVGVTSYTNGQAGEGGAFIYHGGPAGISTTAAAIVESDQPYAQMGTGVSGAGDVNGDGYGDVIVGAYHYDDTQPDAGAAFVYHGGPSGISTIAATLVSSSYPYAYMGHSVSGAGDVNGDGFTDVIVGAGSYASGETEEGVAFIYHGSASGISILPATGLEHDQAYAYMGHSVSGAGDVNGDGFADVIVGASQYDSGNTNEGVALVYHGNSDGRPVIARQLRGNGDDTPVQPWGISHDVDDFQVRMVATHPEGLGRAKLQVEYCGPGVNFGDPGCETITSTSWEGISTGSRTLTITIPGLAEGSLYRWRARILHAHQNVLKPGITPPPIPAHGPWRRLAGQNSGADIRIGEAGGSPGTVSAILTCAPPSGTVPFVTNMSATLINTYIGQTRRFAAKINFTTGSGQFYPNWRSGWTNVAAGDSYASSWNQTIPALTAVLGSNLFQLVAEDVTPAPYNQPPYPPAGDTDTSSCTVIGIAP